MEKERERERDREKGKEGGKEERKFPRLEVYLPDAVPKAFEMVLSYIYTDRIYPAGVNGACPVTVEAPTSFHPLWIWVVFLQANESFKLLSLFAYIVEILLTILALLLPFEHLGPKELRPSKKLDAFFKCFGSLLVQNLMQWHKTGYEL